MSFHISPGPHSSQTWGISKKSRHVGSFGVGLRLILNCEYTSRLHSILSTNTIPLDVSGISFPKGDDAFAIHGKFPILSIDSAMELPVSRIICVVKVNEGVINGNNVKAEASPGDQYT